jgi:hypothetical protein
MHTLKTGIRYGLTAAIVVMFAGAFYGCASDSPTDVSVQPQANAEPICYVFNGTVYCKD